MEVETENESEWALRGHWGAGLPCCFEDPPVLILIASERVSLSGKMQPPLVYDPGKEVVCFQQPRPWSRTIGGHLLPNIPWLLRVKAQNSLDAKTVVMKFTG